MKNPYVSHKPVNCLDMKLARPYILNQRYTCMFPLSEGFKKGTIFPELYKPYKKKIKKDRGK